MKTQPIIEQPHDWWKTIALGVAALAAFIVLTNAATLTGLRRRQLMVRA